MAVLSNGQLVWLLGIICCLPRMNASTVQFSAAPAEIKANITKTSSMRCSLEDVTLSSIPTPDVRHVSSIFVTKADGTDVASITTFDPATALADLGALEVKGIISATSNDGFLELSWSDASRMTLGGYKCIITGIDTKGHTIVMNSDLQMTSVAPFITDVIELVQKQQSHIDAQETSNANQQKLITDLNTLVQSQKQDIANQAHMMTSLTEMLANQSALIDNRNNDIHTLKQKDVIKSADILSLKQQDTLQKEEISKLQQALNTENADVAKLNQCCTNNDVQIHTLNQQIVSLNTTNTPVIQHLKQQDATMTSQIAQQSVSLAQLQQKFHACSSAHVGFTAVIDAGFDSRNQITFRAHSVVKYDKRLTNEGGDYHSQTGEFVCTQPGLYFFSVHALSDDDHNVCLMLQVNGNEVTSAVAQDEKYATSTSTSAALRLRVGDVVRVYSPCSSEFSKGTLELVPHANSFSGFLLQSDYCLT